HVVGGKRGAAAYWKRRATKKNPARKRLKAKRWRKPSGLRKDYHSFRKAYADRRKARRGRMPAGLARYWAKHGTRTRRRHRMPKPLRDYWAKHRRNPARRRPHPAHERHPAGARLKWVNGRWVNVGKKRGGKARRSKSMAKGSKKRSAAMKRYWRARKR